MQNPSELSASVIICLGAAAWGLYWIPIRFFEANGIDGSWTVTLLNAPGALVLLPILIWRFRRERAAQVAAMRIGLVTGLGLALYATSVLHTDVVRATLLFYLTPVWGTIIGVTWMKETATWQRCAAIALGLGGLGLLVLQQEGSALNFGDLTALAAGIAWAAGASMIRHERTIPVISAAFYQFVFLAICALAFGYLFVAPQSPDLVAIADLWWLILLVALLGLVPAVLAIFWAQQFLSSGRSGLLMMSEVVVAMITAAILLPDERLSGLQWLGAALIICAGIVELIPARRQQQA